MELELYNKCMKRIFSQTERMEGERGGKAANNATYFQAVANPQLPGIAIAVAFSLECI